MKRILKDFQLFDISKKHSLRELFAKHFKSLGGELPIKGGWGYSKEDAIIIDSNDEVVEKGIPFDGIGLEHLIVKKRLLEELIIFKSDEDKTSFSNIQHKVVKQSLLFEDNNRKIDHLVVEGTCFLHHEWLELKNEMFSGEDDFDLEAHFEKEDKLIFYFTSEYFFDITSFYGKY